MTPASVGRYFAVLLASVLTLTAAAAGTASAASSDRLIVIHGNSIVSVPVGKGQRQVLRRFSEGTWISSVSTALRTTDIAYSLRIKHQMGGYTLLKDQVWTMRSDGTHPKKHFEQVRKRNRLGLISSTPELWGPRYGIMRVELSPGGRRILVTKDYPFVAFEVWRARKGLKLANPRNKDGIWGMSNPTYDHTGRRILGYLNGGRHLGGIGYVIRKTGKPVLLGEEGYDFLSSTTSASPDGRFIAVLAGLGKDKDPSDGYMPAPFAIRLIDWKGRTIRTIRGPRPVVGPLDAPRISPDGRLVAFTAGASTIGTWTDRTWVVSIRGGRPRPVHTGKSSFRVQFPAWVWSK